MEAWSPGPSTPELLANEVHVWSASLAVGPDRMSDLSALLNAEERQRAARYIHIPSREQYIVARGLLRILLGSYLNLAPGAVCFTLSPQGKPELAPPGQSLHFNVSHSQARALIAFTRIGPVGIDIEHMRTVATYLDMAERFFTPGEASALTKLPIEQSQEAFFHVWTRKEAFLKAIGLGLSHGLERFEVSVPPDDPPRILHIDGDRHSGARWSLQSLFPATGYIGALAIEAQGHRLNCWSLDCA